MGKLTNSQRRRLRDALCDQPGDLVNALDIDEGEANTASNLGSGIGVFAEKIALDLRFKSLVPGPNVTIEEDGEEITISATGGGGGGDITDATNIGEGSGIYAAKSEGVLFLKSLVAGTNVNISNSEEEITINVPSVGEINSGANVGSGEGIFAEKDGLNLLFKTLVAGTNITIDVSDTEITINASGGGGGGDVTGPDGVSADGQLVIFDGLTGKTIRESSWADVGGTFGPLVDDAFDIGTDNFKVRDIYVSKGVHFHYPNNGIGFVGYEDSSPDRLRIKADTTLEVITNETIRLYIANNFPQVSIINSDLIIEPNDGDAGCFWWATHGTHDFGRSTVQQAELPGPRGPRDIYYARNIRMGNGSTTAGLYGGGDGATQQLISNFFKINPVNNSRYYEILLDVGGLHKMQTDMDFWFNDQSQIYFFNSGQANIRRAGTATLVGGTVTVPNITVSPLTHIKLQRKTAGGTTGDLTYTKIDTTSFTINSDNAGDTSEIEWQMFEVWNL